MLKLVIDDKIPFIRGEAECLGQTVYLPGKAITAQDVADADALIVRTRTLCNRSLLEGSRVKYIATATIGYDHLDTHWLATAGIGWTNCPGCNATSVAQYVESCLLLAEADGLISIGPDTTIGIVGVGHVGSAVAQMAQRLGLRLLLCDPPRLKGRGGVADGSPAARGLVHTQCGATLDEVARQADIITLHTPLTRQGADATFHLCNTRFFDQLTRRPLLINAARGEVVDTEAVLKALERKQIAAAAIDTWENEPDINPELLERAWMATPHIAGYSADGKALGTEMALNAVARHFGIDKTFRIVPPSVEAGFRYFKEAPDRLADCLPALALYDPRRDSLALKASPASFEQLRGNYPLRREVF
ncbi:MAG: 4-phosphoerythronate dehydrogenase [Alloprevotella sp.]